jgi:hypothetical protein
VAYFLYVATSGRDGGACPYAVLSGVAVEERDLWNLAQAVSDAQFRHFGRPLDVCEAVARPRNLLKRKTFRLAAQMRPLELDVRRELARGCLTSGDGADRRTLTALAQAKLAYVGEVLELCARFRCRFVASIAPCGAASPPPGALRKDYLYLFERFFYFLDDLKPSPVGVVVIRDQDGPLARQLGAQMDRYFKHTTRGRQRASQVVAEPLVARGELTTGSEIAALVAYVTAWGFRTRELTAPARRELYGFKEQVRGLRYRAVREVGDNPNFVIWGFSVVNDLRVREDREGGDV